MAKKTKWYYVLVMTNQGPVFVTGLGEGKWAKWNCEEQPKEFSKDFAEDIAFGLTVNGHIAYAVCTKYEIEGQPYQYKKGEFAWRWFEKGEKDND